ncbi:MAG: carboxypeptidase regulatory-like domain-containing protein, partial [Gemmatimonadetes bacterium]|nr:carboxypeptidase regulatory-like domain-containing protein [Gemmatimonadota bacterium]
MFSMVLHAAHFAAACCAADVAQTVRGTVRDSSGAGLPNVQVVVAEANRSATTNAGGEFTIRGLAAGEYHLTTLLVGYRPGHAVVQVANSGPDVVVNIVMSAT